MHPPNRCGFGSCLKLLTLFKRSTAVICLLVFTASVLHAVEDNAASFSTSTKPAEAIRISGLSPQESINAVAHDLEAAVTDHETQAQSLQASGSALPQPSTKYEHDIALAGVPDTRSEWENILLIRNAQVQVWEGYFSEHDSARLRSALLRLAPHREHVEGVLAQMGLPRELMMVAFVESEFAPNAVSPKGATGLWQFMPVTAARYGLRQETWVDERADIEKSTVAAARYLADLHELFGDWLLTLAAYNAGEETVLDAMMKGKTRDFWTLSRLGLLPEETQSYIPKVLGALRAWKEILPHNAEISVSKTGGVPSERRTWVYAINLGD